MNNLPRTLDEVDALLTGNRIWIDRTQGVGPISKEDALEYGFTGPCLRATGIPIMRMRIAEILTMPTRISVLRETSKRSTPMNSERNNVSARGWF